MPTFTALTTLTGREDAYRLGDAMEGMTPAPTGVGVFEMEDGSGLWEVGGYFEAACPKPTGSPMCAVNWRRSRRGGFSSMGPTTRTKCPRLASRC